MFIENITAYIYIYSFHKDQAHLSACSPIPHVFLHRVIVRVLLPSFLILRFLLLLALAILHPLATPC